MASPIVLVLGAGANIGANVARVFAAKGYKVAVTSRTVKKEHEGTGYLSIQTDFTDPSSMKSVFSQVKQEYGSGPSVVVYNAASTHFSSPTDPLGVPLADFITDLTINTTSVLAAAQEALTSFNELPATASRTFIYTGNGLNMGPIGPILSLGVGKTATAHIIASAANAYKSKGFKFYFADERKPDGKVGGTGIDGPAHAELYLKLSEDKEQGPWQQTFVKGTGYVDFPHDTKLT